MKTTRSGTPWVDGGIGASGEEDAEKNREEDEDARRKRIGEKKPDEDLIKDEAQPVAREAEKRKADEDEGEGEGERARAQWSKAEARSAEAGKGGGSKKRVAE